MENKKFLFAAIDPYLTTNIILPIEEDSKKGYINWGVNNDYPLYLEGLYQNVATLSSIINGCVDYIAGDYVEIDDILFKEKINTNDDNINDLIKLISKDLVLYGGFAINVIRSKTGNIAGLYYINLKYLRISEDKNTFYYSKDFGKGKYGRIKYQKYPKFQKNSKEVSSIFYYNNNRDGLYPTPIYQASIKSAEIEKNISEYWLNSLANGFSSSYMVNFNNGLPDDEEKEEIEEYFNEKYSGYQNAGRILLSFSEDKEHSAELVKLEQDDFGERYKSLVERTRQEIFTSFRAIPNLFGLTTSTGFSNEEYLEAFDLFNTTMIIPMQDTITRCFKKIGLNIKINEFKIKNNK